MCGGLGTRLDFDGEKACFEIGGVPMIDRVIEALAASRIEQVFAVVSPDTPRTAAHVDVPVIEGPGEGYVADLERALDRVDTPVLTVGADLPLLAGDAIDWVLDGYDAGSAMVAVPVELKRSLGVSIDATIEAAGQKVAPTGVNVVGPPEPEQTLMTTDTRFAVNVNRLRDAWVATVLDDRRDDGPR
ncbi:NTP transferase domain-containing protein [Halodesulfurarchaeum sp. HSR-GB]|uniref:NTP transferase domain-containing protein n=1 Tax=Halodesulfurarchaeum sp. HSR-GB TaxID=3074077 RepID=UPI0028542F8B|nr:NTP transferase domain-containing protein [Halodesulfurarchaeum sp. HSR-GB]MDR5656475.1 NTP transferase domain-containing protein [Halodesulfurarchaeum sp. HSR-GB]